jgi:hypothetical protein
MLDEVDGSSTSKNRAMIDASITLSRETIEAEAEDLAQSVLHTSASEAWRRVKEGELEGTLFAAKLARLFALLNE